MTFSMLDTVMLEEDLPKHGLRAGDIGAVVEVYGEEGIEVEFVTGAAETQALVSLKVSQVRAMGRRDPVAPQRRAAAERTTLNEQFDRWLRRYALAEHETETAMRTIVELQGKLCTEGRHFSRDDMNER